MSATLAVVRLYVARALEVKTMERIHAEFDSSWKWTMLCILIDDARFVLEK